MTLLPEAQEDVLQLHLEGWEGPLDLAARVARERPDIAPLVHRAAGHFAELRYGTGRREHLQALLGCIKQLASFRKESP